MTYEADIVRVDAMIERMRELDINDYQGGTIINRLNPYFGCSATGTTNGINSKGYSSLWMRAGAYRILLSGHPNGYGCKEKHIYFKDMTEKQREGVFLFCLSLVEDRERQIEQWKNNPELDDILPEVEAWAKEFVAEHYPKNSVQLAYGCRQCDGGVKYYALKFDNGASIPLGKDKHGMLWCREQAPLAGQSSEWEWTPDNYRKEIADAIHWCLN